MESERSHGRFTWGTIRVNVHGGRDGDGDGVGQAKEEGDGKLGQAACVVEALKA